MISGMIAAANGTRTFGEALLVFAGYGLFFWRTFKSNPGNRLIECGCITLAVFFAMIPMSSARDVPDWLFGLWVSLTVLLCLATLFFLFQRIFRAGARRLGQ
jgi:hypothetical protein